MALDLISWDIAVDTPEWDALRQQEIIKKETGIIQLRPLWGFYRYILDLVIPDDDLSPLNNSKLYTYYLYSLIKSSQAQCLEFGKQINSSEVLNWLRNTRPDWKEELEWINKETTNCYIRFLVYESIFKQTFNIEIDELNLNIINSKIPIFLELTNDQLEKLKIYILDPIIYGVFGNIFNDKYPVLNCSSSCKIESVDKFPYPISDELKKPPFKTLPDVLRIAVIHNNISFKKKLAYDLIFNSTGIFDSILSGLTGVEKGWTLQLGDWIEDKKETVVEAISDTNKEIKKMYNDLKKIVNTASNTNITESLKPFIILGSVALGLFFADKILPE